MSFSLVNGAGLIGFTFIMSIGQLLFKDVGVSIRGYPAITALLSLLVNKEFYAALFLYAAATLLWIWLLSRLPLSQAYPWSALAIVVVPILSMLFLGERLPSVFWLGIALICVGIYLTQYGFYTS